MFKDLDVDYVKFIIKLFCSGNCLFEYCFREVEEFGYIYVVLLQEVVVQVGLW